MDEGLLLGIIMELILTSDHERNAIIENIDRYRPNDTTRTEKAARHYAERLCNAIFRDFPPFDACDDQNRILWSKKQ